MSPHILACNVNFKEVPCVFSVRLYIAYLGSTITIYFLPHSTTQLLMPIHKIFLCTAVIV